MPNADDNHSFDELALQRFLSALKDHLNRPDAPGDRLAGVQNFVSQLKVTRTQAGVVLALNADKMGSSSVALHALHEVHLKGFTFTARENQRPIQIRRLERIGGRGPRFVPVTTTQSWEAEVREDLAYGTLIHEIMTMGQLGQVTMVQHSNTTTAALVNLLLGKGADVRLLVQSDHYALPKADASRMATSFGDTKKRYSKDGGSLTVFRYPFPASMRAVLLHNELLSVSWYNYMMDSENPESGYAIWGHDQPTLVVRAGSASFDSLSGMVLAVADSVTRFIKPDVILEAGRNSRTREVIKPTSKSRRQ